MTEKYKHIIWDWNGTIFNDLHLALDIVNGILKDRGVAELSVERYLEVFTFPVQDYYAQIGLDLINEPFEVVGMEWATTYEKRKGEAGLHEGVAEKMEEFFQAGKAQSILSAYKHDFLEEMVSHYGLRKYLNGLLGMDNVYAESKVHIGLEMIKQIGCPKNEAVLIGDTLHDLDVANEMGIDCILIASGHQPKHRLEGKGAVAVLNSAKEL
ncbi:phosphatase [bacterium BRH_c32]|nr:MAG: phosphatase [bacterium BRH_c32]